MNIEGMEGKKFFVVARYDKEGNLLGYGVLNEKTEYVAEYLPKSEAVELANRLASEYQKNPQ